MLSTAHRYFLEVAATGSIKRAAARLHIASSALSRQISRLEETTEARLFERRREGMVLTQAGELLADHVRRVAMDSDGVLRHIRNLQHVAHSTIRIGTNEGVAHNLLPDVLAQYRQQYPEVTFQVRVGSPGFVQRCLREGSIDIGLMFSLKPGSDVEVRHEIPSPICAIMGKGHPLADHTRLELEDLKNYPLAMTDSGTTVQLLFDVLSSGGDGSHFNPAYSSNSSSLIRALVEGGHAVTLAGEITLCHALAQGSLIAVPLADEALPTRSLQVLTAEKGTLKNSVERFMTLLIAALQCHDRAARVR
ncbi:LysR family transcriptional regulator [Pollutimonas bauzanensis]|uniref:LysR family transcriptional regulator n=1 Tax=Pollutimonas bauzanensis TaxID=658167 RepID=UPI00333E5C66